MRKYELCRKELQELLEDAELPEARRLVRLVDAQLALNNPAGEPKEPRPRASGPAGFTGDGSDRDVEIEVPRDILTHEDVNLIRVFEIDFDHPPRVQVEPDTIKKLIETYSDNKLIPESRTERNSLFHADSIDIVEHLIFELKARELYPEINVITEPYALNLFRLRVHNTWLMNNCASTACHGGTDGGRLFLYRNGYRDARVRYTNFLILERLKLDPALPPMIDYDTPQNSLMIQYGMPREEARYPHPEVAGWEPAFPAGNRKLIEATTSWIEAMMLPRPVYPVEFEPPVPAQVTGESEPIDEAPKPRPAFGDPETEREGRKPR
jgi:hypothetical protein